MLVDLLPGFVIMNLGVFGLIITGYLVEKNYVGRPAIFANGIALNVHVYQMMMPPKLLVWYADLGMIFGAFAILSYASEEGLPGGFYDIAWYIYSSFAVGIIILITL